MSGALFSSGLQKLSVYLIYFRKHKVLEINFKKEIRNPEDQDNRQ